MLYLIIICLTHANTHWRNDREIKLTYKLMQYQKGLVSYVQFTCKQTKTTAYFVHEIGGLYHYHIVPSIPKFHLFVACSIVTLAGHTCIQTHVVHSGGVF